VPLDPRLLAVLACPQDKGPLYYLGDDGGLYNPRLSCKYLVREGIPVMLVEEAQPVPPADVERLNGKIEAGILQPTFAV